MSDSLNIVYFPSAVLLGALHALEPGHAKALTAAYLIGIKGTKRDSAVLGLSVAATHSAVVMGISAIGLWLGSEAFAGRATQWLEYASGGVAVGIGGWMLWRRLSLKYRTHDHGESHHHAPDPVQITGERLNGVIEIIETPLGERMRFSATKKISEDELTVEIDREAPQVSELLRLVRSPDNLSMFLSTAAPGEPHGFSARLIVGTLENPIESVTFSVTEPEHHHDHHNHAHLDDVAHAQAHASTLPQYVKEGERPSLWQIVAFGAAGGMIPCPASITVMLLALSTGRTALGFVTVLGFSLGLAVTLVGIGVAVVSGLSRISETGRLSWLTRQAPVVSAVLVMVSGLAALLIAHHG